MGFFKNLKKKREQKKFTRIIENVDHFKDYLIEEEINKENDGNAARHQLNAYEKERNELLFNSNIEIIQNTVEKSYLPQIAEKYKPIPFEINDFNYAYRARAIRLKKWVTDSNEDTLDKLGNVYSAMSGVECSIALVYRRIKTSTDVYFVITNQSDIIDPAVIDSYFNIFVSSLRGNFPGVEIEEIENIGLYHEYVDGSLTGEWFDKKNSSAVAMITNIASESSEKFVSQGIEKLLDGVVPSDNETEYTLILLAEPASKKEILDQKTLYEDMYTQLSPHEAIQKSISYSDAVSSTSNISKNLSASYSKSGRRNKTRSGSSSQSSSYSSASTTTKGETFNATVTDYRIKETLEIIESHIKRLQVGEALGMWNFASYVLADNYSIAQNVASMYCSLTEGEESYVETSAINIWNDNRKYSKDSIDIILSYLKAFNHPSFALSGTELMPDLLPEKKDAFKTLVLRTNEVNKTFQDDVFTLPVIVNGFTKVSGKELAMSMNLPGSAVSGLPVIECAKFGRDVISQTFNYGKDQTINLGNIFHMQQEELNKPVLLDAKCMTEHTFVTGSTGAGKSTTIYRILSEASKLITSDNKNVTFMVIEPAKGEYKNEISRISDKPVFVYGSNPKSSEGELLRINPFAFPTDKIHVLEHLDRLIEIFNVCWPMYAAMPAVLKKGIEEAYIACGWDLLQSENLINNSIFPTFEDVCEHIRTVIDKSDYSAENKGDYKGALVTRLESLTNGINGLIFTADSIADEVLFENNSIIDLSRVGSTETKALIMGLLVMKLQEYRMASNEQPNAQLKHITVLEEAHNLLKRTSTEQSSEGSNLLGKSVEMLSNSIAEMRTYGEAFIIADQAPGLLDMSVIRNTNTKIIMRLPDFSDRELVGKSANLDDDQIIEIAKLRPGVAAVYYNGWINPVLCKIPKSEKSHNVSFLNKNIIVDDIHKTIIKRQIVEALIYKRLPEDVDSFRNELIRNGYSGEFVFLFSKYCSESDRKKRNSLLPSLFYLLFSPSNEIKQMLEVNEISQVSNRLSNELRFNDLEIFGRNAETVVLNLLHEQNIRNIGFNELYSRFGNYYAEKYKIGG